MDREVTVGGYMMFINSRVELDGVPIGAACMSLSVDALAKGIAAYRIGGTGFAYLVRPDGAIMMHRDSSLIDGKHFMKDQQGLPGMRRRRCWLVSRMRT